MSVKAGDGKSHYSYELYADPRMAEAFDGMRFSGPVGRLIAEQQAQVIGAFLDPLAGKRILDVGTGTGRGAIALALRGARVTGVDASAEMLAVARRRAAEAQVEVDFVQGDAHGLAYPDQSFDAPGRRGRSHPFVERNRKDELAMAAGDAEPVRGQLRPDRSV